MLATVADLRTDPRPGGLSYQRVGELLWDRRWDFASGECCPMAQPLCPTPASWWDAAEVGAVGTKRRLVQPVNPSQRMAVLPGKKRGARDNNLWEELSHGKILFRIELPRWLAAPGVLPLKSLLLLMSLRYISSL